MEKTSISTGNNNFTLGSSSFGYYSTSFPDWNYPITNTKTTSNPQKIKLVEKLVKEGHISLNEGLILLEESIIVYNHNYPSPWADIRYKSGDGI